MSIFMPSEKTREIREWLTFGISALTLIAIPVGLLILRNQRLEIERDFGQEYVHKALFVDHMNRMDGADKLAMEEIGKLNGKVDVMLSHQQHMDASLTSLRDNINIFRGQNGKAPDAER